MIYTPTPISPINGEGIDITEITRFSWKFGASGTETQTSYQIKVYTLDDTLTYDSGSIASVNEYHDVPATTFTGNVTYKWLVTTNGLTSSNFVIFKALATGIVTIDTLPDPFQYQFYTFTATYTQAQNILPKSFEFILYSATDDIIARSGVVEGIVPEYEFNGLENATTFKIECTITNQLNVTSTSGKVSFTTNYTFPYATDLARAYADDATGTIIVDWTAVITQIGYVTGTYDFETGVWGQCIHLHEGSYLNYDLDVNLPLVFSSVLYLKLPSTFTGPIFRFYKNGKIEYEIGYYGNTQKFYYQRGKRITSGVPTTLPTDWFKFIIHHNYIGYKIGSQEYYIR